jgi:hypothetical protein
MIAEPLIDQIAELRLALNSIRAAIAVGATVDLLGFDEQVAKTLEQARLAPRAERAPLIDALEKLIEEIDAVGVELRLHRDFDTARRASGAYSGTPR